MRAGRDARRDGRGYDLVRRNCATDVIATLNRALGGTQAAREALGGALEPGEGLGFVPFVLFEQVRDRFKDRLVFIVAFDGDEPIAGTFNVAKGDAMYGRYWGTKRYVRHLHFNVCYYAAVEYCIAAGIDRFEPGAGGDYKQLRGFDAQPTYSAHFLAEPRLADAVASFLESERAHARENIEWIQEHSALKPSGD